MSCHASEEALERYCLGTCDEQELAAFEEHLLVCHVCQDRVLETDLLLKPMRAALAEKFGQRGVPAGDPGRRRPVVSISQSRLFWVPVLGVFALLLYWQPFRSVPVAPQVVALATFRGSEANRAAHAPRNAAIKLEPDLSGLAESPSYRIEVVGSDGSVHRQGVLEGNGRFAAGVLARGYYWVRLYDHAGKLLREYALEVG